MKPTFKFTMELIRLGFDVINCVTPIGQDGAMGFYLKKYWCQEDIMILGQDNVPTINMVHEMQDCPADLCVNPCISYPASTALDRPMMNQIDKDGKMYEIDDRPHSVYYGGTGFCKIGVYTQKKFSISQMNLGFPSFDSDLFHLGIRNWHCHYPLHDHMKDSLEFKHWT